MSLEQSSSAPAGDVGAGCWEAREEVATRLEAMAAAALVDDELPEEQLQANSRIQEDELLALQAIYGDDMLIFDNMDGLRFFQISRHYQLQGDIQVYMNVCTNETTETGDDDEELAGRNFIYLPCNHSFCIKCMETCCSIHMKEGSVTMLACPDTSCRAPLPPQVLRRLLADEVYARWESLALRRTLDTMPDVAYCPRCNAACVAAGDDTQCAACFFTFCARCGERRHVGYDCVPALDKLEGMLAEQQKLKASAREERTVEELLSLREVLLSTRQCPSCKMAIAKTGGCNKMVCGNCGQFFCYRCGRAITGYAHFHNKMVCGNCGQFFCYRCGRAITGYAHFQTGDCGLFDRGRVGMGRLPGRVDGHYLDEDIERLDRWMRAIRYTCPTCGAKRSKGGANNLLACQRCQARYCALCGKRVWEVSQHYGPWGNCHLRG